MHFTEITLLGKLQSLFKNSDGIISYPRLSERELIKAYQNALALINISYHEGFGLPLLEAMYLGCPVICSKIPAYHELFSDASTMVDPLDIKAIAKAIQDVTKGGPTINDKVVRGKELASTFSYKRSAQKILDSIYSL